MTKRVLMLCYFFPPVDAIGALRSVAFTSNLRDFGWEPIVISVTKCKDRWVTIGNSRAPEGVTVFRVPELGLGRYCDYLQGALCRIARIFGREPRRHWFRDIFCFPDAQATWFPAIKGISLARSIDVVYVSCSPFSAALNGVIIKAVTGRPLVLDFRDAWNVPLSGSTRRSAMLKHLERFVLRYADLIILNTLGAERIYRNAFPDQVEKFLCIPNGYDYINEDSSKLLRGDNAEFIARYADRSYVVTSGSHEDLRHAVLKAYEDRLLQCGVNEEFIRGFRRRELTKMLAARLSELTSGRGL